MKEITVPKPALLKVLEKNDQIIIMSFEPYVDYKGNSLTLTVAREALEFALKHREKGFDGEKEGYHVLATSEEIIYVDKKEVKIGCCTIPWRAITAFAKKLEKFTWPLPK